LALCEEARNALLQGKFSSAIEFFQKSRQAVDVKLPLAWKSSPNPGNMANMVDLGMRVPELQNALESSQEDLSFFKSKIVKLQIENRANSGKIAAEKQDLEQENDLLLNQLHTVQEELERFFLKNKESLAELDVRTKERDEQTKLASERQSELEAALKAKDEQTKLASERQSELEAAVKAKDEQTKLASERQSELEAALKAKDEQTKLASERQTALEGLRKELEASKVSGGDVEKKRAELAGQLEKLAAEKATLEARVTTLVTERDARTKERDERAKLLSENQVALEVAVKERDQFKKTAVDRASRIAELEAQVADQAERQKQIDEQMIRAETQLEMLKEFLQPAFQ
jgi:chromosome segregation ATPase